jgi:hypothetical protein
MFFLESEKLISPHQHGFRSKRSTLTNTLTCLNTWFSAVNSGNVVHSIFLDFSKAFDTVSHPKLIHKLKAYGISGKLLDWISAFLAGRTQKVNVENEFSSTANVSSGVPQGSVLGPILFLLYVNDLPEVVTDASVSLFADDSKLYVICPKNCVSDPNLSKSLTNVHDWAETWQLQLSLPKCSIFCFGKPDKPP